MNRNVFWELLGYSMLAGFIGWLVWSVMWVVVFSK
jgi:hypothetical protein